MLTMIGRRPRRHAREPREGKRPGRLPAPQPPQAVSGAGRPANPETRPRIYAAIVEYAAAHGGHTPSYRQLQEIASISSTSVVGFHVNRLIKDGELERKDGHIIVIGGVWTPPDGSSMISSRIRRGEGGDEQRNDT